MAASIPVQMKPSTWSNRFPPEKKQRGRRGKRLDDMMLPMSQLVVSGQGFRPSLPHMVCFNVDSLGMFWSCIWHAWELYICFPIPRSLAEGM